MLRTCPKCGGILSDSAKICMDCRYQFQPGELQEILDRDESVRENEKNRVSTKKKKLKKIITIISLSVLAVCLTVTAFRFVCGTKMGFGENYIWFDGSSVIPYEYEVYWDHVEIYGYNGGRYEVDIPSYIWGRPVTVIGTRCFEHKSSIVKVNIPKTVNEIGYRAFINCTELVEVTGGEEVKILRYGAFQSCSKLEVIDLGTKIERIEDGAFIDCEQLKQFTPQDKLQYIGEVAFGRSGLEEFEFNSDADVQGRAFEDTPWQDNHTEQFLIYGDEALLYCKGPEDKIVIPDGVKTLLKCSLEDLKDSEIFLPPTVRKIDEYCFCRCTNIKIYIPSSVEEMGYKTEKYDFPIIVDNCSDVTIVTTKGSYAEEYAKEHDIPCEIVESW